MGGGSSGGAAIRYTRPAARPGLMPSPRSVSGVVPDAGSPISHRLKVLGRGWSGPPSGAASPVRPVAAGWTLRRVCADRGRAAFRPRRSVVRRRLAACPRAAAGVPAGIALRHRRVSVLLRLVLYPNVWSVKAGSGHPSPHIPTRPGTLGNPALPTARNATITRP
ncbi:hypothetical protein GCM10010106_04550 [Thermopolyspora flexuosa]|nr:hypothetical protein GCM10010106_04550 [Thermopolyspora flexuosa]